MKDFSVEGVSQMFGGPFFECRENILPFGQALKFGVISKENS